MIRQLPTSISERLSNNSSSEERFNASKYKYETALKNSGYQQTHLVFNKREHRKQKRICNRNIIWFNPLFLNLLHIHFPESNKLHKIYNKNAAKVSYCCTENFSSIIKLTIKK